MAFGNFVSVVGIDEVVADLKKMDRECRKASRTSARQVINKLKDAIKEAAPEEEGDIKKSIKANVRTRDGGQIVSAAVVIEPAGSHWIPVEFGHSKGIDGKPVPPHPFVYNTRDRLLPSLLDELENAVDGPIKQTASE